MAFQVLLNVFLAFLWMFLQVSFSARTFVIGYLLGLLVMLGMRRFFDGRFYLHRVWALFYLFLLFLKELVKANLDVLKLVLRPRLNIRPGIFAFETRLASDWEVTLLSNLITLTPGTLVVDVSDDNKTLYIHAIDIGEVSDAVDSIRFSFEKAIMEVSRK